MKHFLILIFQLLFTIAAIAQKHDQIWIGGMKSSSWPNPCPRCAHMMHFNNDSIHYEYIPSLIEMRETTPVTISDKEGNLLFYTNGNTIASHDHSIMENGLRLNEGSFFSGYNIYGDSLGEREYAYLSYLILPDSDSEDIFYMLHTYIHLAGLADSVPDEYLWYSDRLLITKIDMSENNGKGRVLYKNKELYKTISGNRINAVRHGNGRDWWVLLGNLEQSEYTVLQLYKDSLVKVVNQQVPSVAIKPFDWLDSTYVRFNVPYLSPDGNMMIDLEGEKGFYRLYDFDRCDGTLQFRDTLDFGIAIFNSLDTGINKDIMIKSGYRDICFSPNSRFIHTGAADGYWQYDLEETDIIASGIKLSGPPIVMEDLTQEPILWEVFVPHMAQGPDGKLYALWRAIHHVVNQPNEKGLASDFCLAFEQPPSCLGVPHHLFTPHYPNYRLGAEAGSPCDTLSSTTPASSISFDIRIYPNPSSGPIYLDITLPEYSNKDVHIEVINSFGQVVHHHPFPDYAYMHTIEPGLLSSGMYYVRLLYNGRQVATERLVVVE